MTRRKAAYLKFESDPELEFEFFLAAELGMTVARLRSEMSADEFMRWQIFHGRRSQRAEIRRKG
jgi:hypothetical protein